MNKNINNFIYSKILDENKLKKNEEILKNLFYINVNYVDEIFNYVIENGNGYKYGIRNNFFDVDINDNIEEVLESIHRITLHIIDINNFSFEENYCINLRVREKIEEYIFDNLKYKMYIEHELNEDNKFISKKEAVGKYIRDYEFNDENSNEEYLKDIIKSRSKNINKKIKRLKGNCSNFGKIESIYNNKGKIYSATSNVYIEIIENYSKNLLYNNDNIKESKHYYLSNIINYLNSYINKSKKFSEIYYFERSTNILFILNMYKFISRIEDENKRTVLYGTLIAINYLPNIIDNDYFISLFIDILPYEGDYSKFRDYVNGFCFELAFLIIPLYEMVFTFILKEYCNKKEIKCDKFFREFYKEFKIDDIKNIILEREMNIKSYLKCEKKFANENELREFVKAFKKIFDLNIFNRTLGSWVKPFNKKFIKNIKDYNIEEYQKNLKNFLVNIVKMDNYYE